ncbi:6-phosphogluconolactonase [Thiomicrorhabdus aquaedulcis]|uniref:6-phosphogluconolactonase n=1 Tax=Thiomicrorhabdus aquaedulcis TaxID=2211106 RepID=UPI001E55E0EE|nr:6-phosphogluconolactonase [Thiomicrorhabdus aquaedulcis]
MNTPVKSGDILLKLMMPEIKLPKNWQVFEDANEVAQHAIKCILTQAQAAIAARGAFHLVTAGGTTPLAIYRLLLEAEQGHCFKAETAQMDWSKWYIYLGDERCLPADNEQRNSFALNQAWLNHSQIPHNQRYFIPTELGAQLAALAYESRVCNVIFDVVLLGMGEDGHTASLFPGHDTLQNNTACVLTEFNSPKPPLERVTLSAHCLANTRMLIKLITGNNKQEAVTRWLLDRLAKNVLNVLPIATVNAKVDAKTNLSGETWVFCSKDSLPNTEI